MEKEINTISQAVNEAKKFLREAGAAIIFCTLKEAKLEGNKWKVIFEETLLTEKTVYELEIDKKTGNVIGYRKKEIL